MPKQVTQAGPGFGNALLRRWLAARSGPRLIGLLLAVMAGGGVASAQAAAEPMRRPAYIPVTLDPDGGIRPDALNRLSSSVGAAADQPHSQLVVLVHGYNTSQTLGRRQYRQIARDLTAVGHMQGWNPVVVGVHWPSHPGSLLQWLPQMLGYRFISGTGFPKALTNPYLEKSKLAAVAGRTGLRTLLFRLQDNYPRLPLNVFAHSMGSELLIRALSPGFGPLLPATEQPGRTLNLQMAVLAGADLDRDVFLPEEVDGVPEALDRVGVWWITVPRKNSADAALELRRSAGRHEAMGNVGLDLKREQLSALLARRGLVIDNRSVPITHDITAYYTPERLSALSASLRYLEQQQPTGEPSVLEELALLAKTPDAALEPLATHLGASGNRLYLRWRLHPERAEFGPIRIQP